MMSEKGIWVPVFFLLLMVGLIICCPFIALWKRNTYREYTGIVISVEKSTWVFTTTTITIITASDTTMNIQVNGFHDFEIGQTYKIVTKGEGPWFAPNLISAEKTTGGITLDIK